jgi:hypothetical protein
VPGVAGRRAGRPGRGAVTVAFVSGHLDLGEDEFLRHYAPQIAAAAAQGCRFVVGDARGADLLFQRHAQAHGLAVTVFHMFARPRHNAGGFPTVGGFTSDDARDRAMTAASSFDIAWVRPGRERSGTARNLERRAR